MRIFLCPFKFFIEMKIKIDAVWLVLRIRKA